MNHKIKNIIFDLGGVIIPVDPLAYAAGMVDLGCQDIAALHEKFLAENIYSRFETGEITPAEFRSYLRSGVNLSVTDEQLDGAWNLILGEIPAHRVVLLENLKLRYRTFLLSNTNKIHFDSYQVRFRKSFGYQSLDALFEKAYYSFQIGLYKPDPAIFEFMLKDSRLQPEETLFIDDSDRNIETARKYGIQAIHLAEGTDLTEVLEGF